MNRRLAQRFWSVGSPVVVLSEERELIYCNAACGQWLGIEPESLIGRRCDYETPVGDDAMAAAAAALAPPPAVWEGETIFGCVTQVNGDGTTRSRRAVFQPLGDSELDCGGVIVVLSLADSSEKELLAATNEPEATELHRKLQRLRRRHAVRFELAHFVGDSPAADQILRQVLLASQAPCRTLIVGPSGSGREHLARTIHQSGDPAEPPALVPLACSLLDAELLQQTVTAFVRGHAKRQCSRPAALLLLEVDQLPVDAQAELAGFLSLPNFELLTLATARQALLPLAEAGEFRADLAAALSTLVIDLPPLSQRKADIPLLAQLFVEAENAGAKIQHSGFTPQALDQLAEYRWPTNLDELAQVVREAHLKATTDEITVEDLPDRLKRAAEAAARPPKQDEAIDLDSVLDDVQRELIKRAMQQAKGNRSRAAELLGLTRPRLIRRLEQFGLDGAD